MMLEPCPALSLWMLATAQDVLVTVTAGGIDALTSERYFWLLDGLESAARGPRVQRGEVSLRKLAAITPATCVRDPIGRRPTARPSASSKRCCASGRMPAHTAARGGEPARCVPGSGTTMPSDRMRA